MSKSGVIQSNFKSRRRTLFIDGKLTAIEEAMPNTNTPLGMVENIVGKIALSQEHHLQSGANVANNTGNDFNPVKHIRFKFFQFKKKFFNILFQKLFLCRKPSKPNHIVCLCIECDLDPSDDAIVIYGKQK